MFTEAVIATTTTMFGLFCLQIHSRCFSALICLFFNIVKCRRLNMQSHLNIKLLVSLT